MRVWAGVLCALAVASPAHALTDEQRQTLVEHFGKNKDLAEFSSKAVNAVLKDEEFGEFFGHYADALTVVQVADKIADGKDLDAFKMVAGEAVKKAIERFAPSVGGALNFVSWANTGLGLFKDFVFDPWLEKKQMKAYMSRRETMDPEDAIAAVGGWGYIREKALKQLEKQGYNMDLLWEGGEKGKLSKEWEDKLLQFVTASYETGYQRKLLEDAGKKARKEMKGLDKKAKKILADAKDEGDDEGAFAGTVDRIQGKDTEFYVNGKRVAVGDKFTLDTANKLEVRALVVGARRKQSRDLKAKPPKNVTLDGEPSDDEFAYSAGQNSSSWRVTEEKYEWRVAARTSKPVGTSYKTKSQNIIVLTLAADTASETVTLDVTGNVRWQMTGKRAGGDASDSSDESDTAAIVLKILPAK